MGTPTRAARAVLVPFVGSRVIVLGALVCTRHVLTTAQAPPAARAQASLLAWDAAWYRDIARSGYGGVAREGLRFFPLFPLLGRALSWLPGVDAGAGVLVVANAAALVLGFAVYALAFQERSDPDLARRAVWLTYLVPPAFVLVMGYSEALFMTLATVVLLTLRRRAWWIAAAAGFAAGITRPVGMLLAVPALVEAIRTRDRIAPKAIAVGAPVAGSLAYLAWAAGRAPDFLYPLRVQQDSQRRGEWVDPIRAVSHAVRELFAGDHLSAGVHVVSAIVLVSLLVVVFRRWPLSFALYAAVALFVALSSRNLDSVERYGLATIPFMLAGADVIAAEGTERIVLVAASAGLVGASILAFSGVLVP